MQDLVQHLVMGINWDQGLWVQLMNETSDDSSNDKDQHLKSMFRQMGLPIPAFPTAQEVRSKSRALSSSIFDSRSWLRAVVERHEETIQNDG